MQLTSTPAAAAATTQMGDGPASLKEELKKERGFVESVLRITMGGRRNLLNRHGREKSNSWEREKLWMRETGHTKLLSLPFNTLKYLVSLPSFQIFRF